MKTHDHTTSRVLRSRLGLRRDGDLEACLARHLEEGCAACETASREGDALADTLARSRSPIEPSDFARARLRRAIEAGIRTDDRPEDREPSD